MHFFMFVSTMNTVCRNTTWIGFRVWEGNSVSKEEASLWASQLFLTGNATFLFQNYIWSCILNIVCEIYDISHYFQAHYCLSGCDTSDSFGKKLLLFLKWKCMEAKVAWTKQTDTAPWSLQQKTLNSDI